MQRTLDVQRLLSQRPCIHNRVNRNAENRSSSSFESVLQTTAWPYNKYYGQSKRYNWHLANVFAVHNMPNHTKHSFTSSAGCYNSWAKRFSCKISESWKLHSVALPPLENVSKASYHKFSAALNSVIMSLPHALESSFRYQHKEFLIQRLHRTNSFARSRTRPVNEGTRTRNRCGLTRPMHDSISSILL